MIIQNSSGGLDNLLLQVLQSRAQSTLATQDATNPQAIPPKPVRKTTGQDIVSISGDKPNNQNANNQNANNGSPLSQNQSNLVSENLSDIENGFVRTQEFTRGDKSFTRIEEVTTTPERSKRVIIQQNESGSTTALENILDRQEDGSFRLIERFTDETGETKTNVTFDFNPKDADVLLGRPPAPESATTDNPFQILRGTQVDVSA